MRRSPSIPDRHYLRGALAGMGMMVVATSLGFSWVTMWTGGNSWDALTTLPPFLLASSWVILPLGGIVGAAIVWAKGPAVAAWLASGFAGAIGVGAFAYVLREQGHSRAEPAVFYNGVPILGPPPVQTAWGIAWPIALYYGVWFIAFSVVLSRLWRVPEHRES